MRGWIIGFGVGVLAGCGADGGVGAAELPAASEVDASDEVGEVDTSDEVGEVDASDEAGEVDASDEVDASEELDASEDVGVEIDAGEVVDTTWRDALSVGTVMVPFALQCETVACNPTCGQPLGATAGFGLTMTVPDDDGPVMIAYAPPEFPSQPAEPVAVNAEGTFVVSVEVVQTAATNVFTVAGHVGPGRTLTVDSYAWMILQTNGFMAGWTTTKTSKAAQTQPF